MKNLKKYQSSTLTKHLSFIQKIILFETVMQPSLLCVTFFTISCLLKFSGSKDEIINSKVSKLKVNKSADKQIKTERFRRAHTFQKWITKFKRKARKFRKRLKNRKVSYQDVWRKISKSEKCSCGPIQNSSKVTNTEDRVVNGEEASPHEFPWIVSMLDLDGDWFCGGSILTEDYVITAAHCVDWMEPHEALIRIGDHDNSDPDDTDYNKKQSIKIKKIIIHSKYDTETTNNDIALLKLKTRIDFQKFDGTVAPICLPEIERSYTGEKVGIMHYIYLLLKRA